MNRIPEHAEHQAIPAAGNPAAPSPARNRVFPFVPLTAAILSLAFIILRLSPLSGTAFPEIPWIVPFSSSFLALTSLYITVISLGRYAVVRDPLVYWTATGFAVFAVENVFYILSWPMLLPGGGSFIARLPNTAAWMSAAGLVTLAAFLFVAAVSRRTFPEAARNRSPRLRSVASWVALNAGLFLLFLIFEDRLPPMIGADGRFTPILTGANAAALLLFVAGAAVSAGVCRRSSDELAGYLAIAQIAFAASSVAVVLGTRRYDLWWYLNRIMFIGSPLVVLGGFLKAYLGLFRREQEKTREAEALTAELRAARDQAEAANRAKTEFLAHMSHELRTPVSGILSMADILGSRVTDPEHRNYISLVRQSAQSLHAILGNILDLSRIESGIEEPEPAVWDLKREAETALGLFSPAADDKGLTLSLRIDADMPRLIRADRGKIARILRNLLSNAVKYTERGSVTLAISKEDENGRVCRLRFSVIDTGPGIPRDKRETVFESFVRLRKSVTEGTVEGAGLGFTITRRLTELLGGTLELESEPGAGSTFSVTLEVEPVSAGETDPPTGGGASGKPLSILLVEDNRINRLFLELKLKETGYRVTVATHGGEALDAVKADGAEAFDLILMDIQMPVMDGLEATMAIRALPAPASKIPIIALSAFAMKGDEERFLAAGMNAYVTKPVDWEDLSRVIRTVSGG